MALWFLGYPDQALQRSCEALTLVQDVSHSFSQALALFFAAELYECRLEGQRTQEQAEAIIALSTEHGFPEMLAFGTIYRGWALAEEGQKEGGLHRGGRA